MPYSIKICSTIFKQFICWLINTKKYLLLIRAFRKLVYVGFEEFKLFCEIFNSTLRSLQVLQLNN